VKFLYYEDTVQASCLRLMGKKLLVSLAMEGKFASLCARDRYVAQHSQPGMKRRVHPD
jgi:hypothetical protein